MTPLEKVFDNFQESLAIFLSILAFIWLNNVIDELLGVVLWSLLIGAIVLNIPPKIAKERHYFLGLLLSLFALGTYELGQSFVGDVFWIAIVLGIAILFWISIDRMEESEFGFQFDRELKIALTAGVIGSMFFMAVSPVITPYVHHSLAESPAVDSPEPEYVGGIFEQASPEGFGSNDSGDLRYYELWIVNDDKRPILEFSLTVDIPGCIDDSGQKPIGGTDIHPKDIEAAPPGIVDTAESFSKQDAINNCNQGIYISRFPAKRMVVLYFIVDTDPEENVLVDYQPVGPSVKANQISLEWTYVWEYRSIRKFIPEQNDSFTIGNESD